jgi:predicted DNA-binding transcriptional regulator YafY
MEEGRPDSLANGFSLLPGWEADLAGLTDEEALALLVAGRDRSHDAFGLDSALASAAHKVIHTLPATHQATAGQAVQRMLIEPEVDLVTALPVQDDVSGQAVGAVRRSVMAGRKVRILYAATEAAGWRTVDPIGLVTVRNRPYLLATKESADRTYRLSRIQVAQQLPEPAQRPDRVDLEEMWRDRCAQYLTDVDQVAAVVTVTAARQDDAVRAAVAVRTGVPCGGGGVRLVVTFQDAQHAEWALWQIAEDVGVLAPESLRAHLRDRDGAIAARHA